MPTTDPLVALAGLEGVSSAVAAARDAVDAVLRDRGLRAVSGEQRAQAMLLGARASAALADDPERALPGAIRVAGELPELAKLVLNAPGQAIARAHTLIGYGLVPEEQLGRIRPAAAERMAGVRRLLTEPTDAPALLLASIVHAELAVVAPFGLGDEMVARAVEQAVLMARGVDPHGVIAVPVGHRDLAEEYSRRLSGYAEVSGVGPWISYSARALTHAADRTGELLR